MNKFGNAKSISSDMFFGGDSSSDRDANLNRFQGSNSISSDMYFNREGASITKSQSYTSNMQVIIHSVLYKFYFLLYFLLSRHLTWRM